MTCKTIQRLTGVALAILLLLVGGQVGGGRGIGLGADELRHEGDDAVVAVGDDGGADHGVEVLGGPGLADMAGAAVVAMDFVGFVELDAIERNEEAVVEAEEGLQGAVLGEGVEAVGEERVEGIPYTLPISKHRSNR